MGEDGKLDEARRVHLAGQAADHRSYNLLDGALPGRAELVLEGRHLAQPFRLVAAFVMDFHVGQVGLHSVDHLVDRHDAGRWILMTVARILRPAADQAVCHGRRLTVSGCSTGLIKEKQERHVVGEDDDLARLAGLGQPDRHPVAMQMIERGDGIIEHDRGLRVDGR